MNFAKSRKKKPNIVRPSDQTHEQWLAWRSEGLGGSDAAVALGIHPYKCALDLYLDKVKDKRNSIETPATKWGHILEPLVINMIKERYPKQCRSIYEPPLMVDPDYPQLRATMDAGCHGSKGHGIIEAKTALSMHGGLLFKEGLPKHYRAQCLHYLLVSRLDFCILGALTEGYREYFYEIQPDLEELEDLQHKELELWTRMQDHDVFWLLDSSQKTAKALEKLYNTEQLEQPEPIDARGKEDVNRALEIYFHAKQMDKENKELKTQAENFLKAMIGESEELVCDHAIVKWAKTKRGRRFTVKGS